MMRITDSCSKINSVANMVSDQRIRYDSTTSVESSHGTGFTYMLEMEPFRAEWTNQMSITTHIQQF